MPVTVEVAAEYFATTPAAIRMRIKRHTLSAVKDSNGLWQVDLPEEAAQHALGEHAPHGIPNTTSRVRHVLGEEEHDELISLRAERALLTAERDRLLEELDDERNQRKHEFERLTQLVNQQQQLALPGAMKEMPAALPEPEPPRPRRRWWIFGGG